MFSEVTSRLWRVSQILNVIVVPCNCKLLNNRNVLAVPEIRDPRSYARILQARFPRKNRGLISLFVGSMDQESSQQLQMWFSEHFSRQNNAGLFVTPMVSATVEQIWREKSLNNHIPFDV